MGFAIIRIKKTKAGEEVVRHFLFLCICKASLSIILPVAFGMVVHRASRIPGCIMLVL